MLSSHQVQRHRPPQENRGGLRPEPARCHAGGTDRRAQDGQSGEGGSTNIGEECPRRVMRQVDCWESSDLASNGKCEGYEAARFEAAELRPPSVAQVNIVARARALNFHAAVFFTDVKAAYHSVWTEEALGGVMCGEAKARILARAWFSDDDIRLSQGSVERDNPMVKQRVSSVWTKLVKDWHMGGAFRGGWCDGPGQDGDWRETGGRSRGFDCRVGLSSSVQRELDTRPDASNISFGLWRTIWRSQRWRAAWRKQGPTACAGDDLVISFTSDSAQDARAGGVGDDLRDASPRLGDQRGQGRNGSHLQGSWGRHKSSSRRDGSVRWCGRCCRRDDLHRRTALIAPGPCLQAAWSFPDRHWSDAVGGTSA